MMDQDGMVNVFKKIIFLMGVLCCTPLFAEDLQPHTGNFILPGRQQPGPFLSFGQNILSKNQKQIFLSADRYVGVDKRYSDVFPGIVYGITDQASVLLTVPFAFFQDGPAHSTGVEDATMQFEYAFYTKDTSTYSDQATIVGNMTFPTGSTTKQLPTGNGTPGFFIGGTYSRTYAEWLFFTSHGATFSTANGNSKAGNEFLYQGGIGKNLFNIDSKWIVALIAEADGQYSQKNRTNGEIDPNSGGNIIYVTPSLWVSSKQLIIQLGVGFPVAQHLFGDQTREKYLLASNLAWTFG